MNKTKTFDLFSIITDLINFFLSVLGLTFGGVGTVTAQAVAKFVTPLVVGLVITFAFLVVPQVANRSLVYAPNTGGLAPFMELPENLRNYIEPLIFDSGIPNGNPFGGNMFSMGVVSCSFLCYRDSKFGTHYGLDLIPRIEYYQTNQASKELNNLPVVFANCSGFARSYSRADSGNIVSIKCKDSTYTVEYFHLATTFFTAEGREIKAGSPVGIMGGTGAFVQGIHLHYQIYSGCARYSLECSKNPTEYIQNNSLNSI